MMHVCVQLINNIYASVRDTNSLVRSLTSSTSPGKPAQAPDKFMGLKRCRRHTLSGCETVSECETVREDGAVSDCETMQLDPGEFHLDSSSTTQHNPAQHNTTTLVGIARWSTSDISDTQGRKKKKGIDHHAALQATKLLNAGEDPSIVFTAPESSFANIKELWETWDKMQELTKQHRYKWRAGNPGKTQQHKIKKVITTMEADMTHLGLSREQVTATYQVRMDTLATAPTKSGRGRKHSVSNGFNILLRELYAANGGESDEAAEADAAE